MKFNIFNTFQEAKEAENYDYLYQRAMGLSVASGIDSAIIRANNLYQREKEQALDDYIKSNNIVVESQDAFDLAKRHWRLTTCLAKIYKRGDKYVCREGHSDRTYPTIELDSLDDSDELDDNGNVKEEI